jgi:hypothetical protein
MIVYKELVTKLSDVLKPDWIPNFDTSKYYISHHTPREAYEIFDRSFLDKLNRFSKLKNLMIFSRTSVGGIHSDPSEHMGLNFILAKSTKEIPDGIRRRKTNCGIMTWYTRKPGYTDKVSYSNANTPLASYSKDQVDFLTQLQMTDRLTLVKTDIPHIVHPAPNSYRICFSFRFVNLKLTTENSIDRLIELGL